MDSRVSHDASVISLTAIFFSCRQHTYLLSIDHHHAITDIEGLRIETPHNSLFRTCYLPENRDPTITQMVLLRDVYAKIKACHEYTNVAHGNTQVPIARRCSDIVNAIRDFVGKRCHEHRCLSSRGLEHAICKDLIAMGLVRVVIPEPKS